ncbi:MAG: Peptidase M10A and M12B matrixin and adamalysin [Parcubacteria group bacterium GW2011_GWA2_52_8]|nr:MAG: Peptidase M10A and M12B matrixin and adamalysin [Parcubacteria group bacterium GW2011_GWA2_52_8]
MFKKALVFTTIGSLAFAANLAAAAPVGTENAKHFKLRSDAVEVAEGVYKLGRAYDAQTHVLVEGYAIVHKKKGEAKPSGGQARLPACYGYLASGAKWKNLENWVVNQANNSALSDSFVLNTLSSGIAKWEDATDGIIGNGFGVNVLGDGNATSSILVADQTSPDNQNEVYFDNLGSDGTIAVTIVWGIFSGPTWNRRLVEWDQVYNTYYTWSANGETNKMDFGNIAVHELGHSVGMADIYSSSCTEVTMYGYAGFGETKKQTLAQPDINGINKLY